MTRLKELQDLIEAKQTAMTAKLMKSHKTPTTLEDVATITLLSEEIAELNAELKGL